MGTRILRRTKTLFLTFALFSLGLYLVLNTLVEDFAAEDARSMHKHPRDLQPSIAKHKLSNEFQANYIAQGRRKPKTMNMENDDHTNENLLYESKVKNDDDYYDRNLGNVKFKVAKAEKSIKDKYKNVIQLNQEENLLKKYENKHDNGKEESYDPDDNYEDEGDYDDEYYEEEGTDDDEEEEDYENDDATNPPFKPGDFGDIKGFEYYRKPKLKYAEVENIQLKNKETDDKQNLLRDSIANQNDKGEAETKKDLTENGIFWSQYVESLIPKGKIISATKT